MAIYHSLIPADGRPMLTGVAFGIPGDITQTPNYTALLDTGTYHTLVGQGIIDSLGLNLVEPDNVIENFGGAHGAGTVRVYNNITIIPEVNNLK